MKRGSVFAVGIALSCALVLAQESESYRLSLKGLGAIGVSIADIDPALECEGFGKDRLRSDVEGPLRQAGIKILTQTELLKAQGNPQLYVNLSLINLTAQSQRVYNIRLDFIQEVALLRDPQQVCRAVTWSVSFEGIAGSDDIDKIVGGRLTDLVDRFIAAYRSVNPT